MRLQAAVVNILLLLGIGGCSSIEVHTDYDSSADFSRYANYAWVADPRTGNPLMDARIVAAVDEQLLTRGWHRMPPGQADVDLAARVTTRENERVDTMYSGGGPGFYRRGYGGFGGMGMATSTVTTYTVGTLIIDLSDARTKKALWRGTASGTVSSDPGKNVERVRESLQEMFENFPPGHRGPAAR